MWQDYTFFAANLVFVFSLIPMVKGNGRVARRTSIPTVVGLFAIAVASASLGLWRGTSVTLLEAGMWSVIAARGMDATA